MDKPVRVSARFQSQSTAAPQIGYALQGGGNHGAFTWGVMRVLQAHMQKMKYGNCGYIGDSAGAMNAVYAAAGWAAGKPGYKAQQSDFMQERLWWTMHREAYLARHLASAQRLLNPTTALSEMIRHGGQQISNVLHAGELLELNARHPALPAKRTSGQNHLEYVVGQQIDFAQLAKSGAPVVIVNTSNVRDGGLEVFYNEGLSAKAVAGSGTLPQLFGTMHIGDSAHWDGGFIANPPIQPLYNACPQMTDLFLIRITPLRLRTDHIPRTDAEHADRTMELLLNSGVEAELRWAHQAAAASGRRFNIHVISVPDNWPHDLHSKVDFQNTHWDYFTKMRLAGEKEATQWLEAHAAHIGQHSTYRLPYRMHGGQAAGPVHGHVKYG